MLKFITLSHTGIGRAIAEELLHDGCRVVIADFDEVKAEEWMNKVISDMDNNVGEEDVKFIDTDVKSTAAIHKTLEEAKAWLVHT